MPAEPIYVTAMKALAARLRTITAGPVTYPPPIGVTVEYFTTPGVVTRALLKLDQYKATPAVFPVLGVIRSSWTARRQATRDPDAEHELTVQIAGYVLGEYEGGTNVIASDRLAQLYDDVLTAINVDRTLGGTIIDCRPHPEGRVQTDDGEYEPYAAFAEPWLLLASTPEP